MSTPKKNKTLLKVNPVSSGHWSSGKSKEDLHQTRCVVHIVKASQLLASDADTGKSDPICFMKFCPQYSSSPDWNLSHESGILTTAVIPACTDPIWNSHHTFPLILESYQELLNAHIKLLIRDQDEEEDGGVTFEDLGQVEIPLKEAIKVAKVAQRHNHNAFTGAPVWHTVEKCPGMRKKDGKILVSISIHFEDTDTKDIQKEVGAKNLHELMSKYKADANAGDSQAAFSSTSAGSRLKKKSTASLTPRVASPVRLFNDSAKAPLFELSIPEEKFQKDKKDNDREDMTGNDEKPPSSTNEDVFSKGNNSNNSDTLTGQQNEEKSAVNINKLNSHMDANLRERSADENMDSDAFRDTLGAVQNKDFDEVTEREKLASANEQEAQQRESQEEEEQKKIAAARLKDPSEEQSKALLDTAVQTAKAEAEVEAARSIAQAMAEIESAKEAAQKQLEVDDAVRKATRAVKRDTEEKIKRLQKEAEEEAEKIKQAEEQEDSNAHTGDLYWDENDNIAGGNDMVVDSHQKEDSSSTPSNLNTSVKDAPTPDTKDDKGGAAKEELPTSTSSSPASKSRRSKIPKLKKSSSSSSTTPTHTLTTSAITPVKDKNEEGEGGKKKHIESRTQIEKRKKEESRSRIRQAKKSFKKKQAEDEANGSLMEFISLEEPTGGDENLPPGSGGDDFFAPTGGGDELLPDMDDDNNDNNDKDNDNNDNDEDSVASTTVDEEEFLPRKSASFPGQGNRPDTIRALRDIAQQREHMDKALAELQRSSEEKFSIVQKQLLDFKTTGEFERYPDDRQDVGNDIFLKNNNNQLFPTLAERMSNNHTNPSIPVANGDTRDKIATILQNGDIDDIGMMLDKFQAGYTEVLSLATRAQLFEYISLLLRRGKFKDSCLNWVVALLNTSTGENLVQNLPEYTCKAIVDALVMVSSEPSNRGVLAARLEAQMCQQYSYC